MLAAHEFTVGYLGDARPLSLILPRTTYEYAMLVGHVEGRPTAVFLSSQHRSYCLASEGNTSWKGLIVPEVRIEVDETSLFDPATLDSPFCSIIRRDTRLAIRARRERPFGDGTSVTLHDNLASAGDLKAGFSKWQVVVGEGACRRVLWSTDRLTAEGV